MRHPFANVQHYASELGSDDAYDSEDVSLDRTHSEESAHKVPLIYPHGRHPDTLRSASQTEDAPRVVRRSRRLTVLLGGQEPGSVIPSYRHGGTLHGILAVLRPYELLSVRVVAHGYMNLSEIAGPGRAFTELMQEFLYSWDADSNSPLPSRVPFRYNIPADYLDPSFGKRLPLPPSFHAYLSGIPGLTVHVSYHVAVDMLYTKRQGPSWRKRRCLRVPFILLQTTRPSAKGPFRLSLQQTVAGPRTLFTFYMQSRQTDRTPIETHVFLPQAQICSIKEPIPFFVTLFANDAALSPFMCYEPSTASFHPLSSPSETSISSLQRNFKLRQSASVSPLRIILQRTFVADVHRGGVPCIEERSGQDFTSKCIGQGVVHSISRRLKSVTWAGTLTINGDVSSGAFIAGGLRILDSIVVSIKPPDVLRNRWMPLCETIPVRLTTESYGCPGAVVIESV